MYDLYMNYSFPECWNDKHIKPIGYNVPRARSENQRAIRHLYHSLSEFRLLHLGGHLLITRGGHNMHKSHDFPPLTHHTVFLYSLFLLLSLVKHSH